MDTHGNMLKLFTTYTTSSKDNIPFSQNQTPK